MRKRSEVAAPVAPPVEEAPKRGRLHAQGAPTQSSADVAKIPHDTFNELVVISAVLVDKAVADRLLPALLPETFFGKGHAAAWAILKEMQARGLYFDPATVSQMSGGQVDPTYLEQLARDRPVAPPNLTHHVRMLMWDRDRIECVRGPLAAFQEALRDVTSDPEKVIALAQRIPESIKGHGSQKYLRSSSQIVLEQSQRLTLRRQGQATFPYCIEGLDYFEDDHPKHPGRSRFTPGAAPGKVTIFTARTGGAKSTMAARAVLGWANRGERVLWGAWEPGEGNALELCAALSLQFDRSDLLEGRYSEEDQRLLEEEMERLGEFIQFFRLPFGRTRGEKNFNDRNLDLVQQTIADSHAQHFVADLIRRALKETKPDDEEQAAFRLQAMAQEQHVHHLWLHQQNVEKLEQSKDHHPTIEATKGSKGWAEASDTIIAWHREAQWKNVPDDRIKALILKQRDGRAPLAVEFEWSPEFGSVSNGRSVDFTFAGEGGLDDLIGDVKPTRGGRRRGNI
jgi:replicative DNA helicase